MQIIKTALTLEDLPAPPSGKTGWPWTEQSQLLPERMPDGSEWPRITLVTPSYNQGQFIEETIRSVLLQGYSNLEYIVIDGGSTDNSVDIIKKYTPWLSYWISEKDSGQSEAINKGFVRTTGQIMGWLNSDDLLVSCALSKLASVYKPGLHWWNGNALHMLSDKSLRTYSRPKGSITRNDLLHARLIIPQVSTFWTYELWNKVGASLSLLNMAMDYELWLRFSEHSPAIVLEESLGIYKTHDDAKTGTEDGIVAYFTECNLIRLNEYQRRHQGRLLRFILITFWTRAFLAKHYDGWRSWIGRRQIPYI
jgi:glycosyltransferase involved in cell wall biosynthesis